MITLAVTSYNGVTLARPITAEFDDTGGSIGRSPGNALVLPDPGRHISRIHATLVCRGGHFVLQDKGTAVALELNGRTLGNGVEAVIAEGDEVKLGGYTIIVTTPSRSAMPIVTAPATEAIDDALPLFGVTPADNQSFALHPSEPAAVGEHEQENPSQSPTDLFDRSMPLGAEELQYSSIPVKSAAMDDPFGARSVTPRHAIPDDFDAMAGIGPVERSDSVRSDIPADLDFVIGRAPEPDKIDAFFGLQPMGTADAVAAASPLGAIQHEQNHQQENQDGLRNDIPEVLRTSVPPLAPLDTPIVPTTSDAIPVDTSSRAEMVPSRDVNDAAIDLTRAVADDRKEIALPPHVQPGLAQGKLGNIPFASEVTSVEQGAKLENPVSIDSAIASKIQFDSVVEQAAQATDTDSNGQPGLPTSDAQGADELMRAFLKGAGVPDLQLPAGFSSQMMAILGSILREAMQGTVDLLSARATVKHEVRVESAAGAAKQNNPLKSSPNVESALSHILAPDNREFMSPLRAIRDAFDDLRLHQTGSAEGTRTALNGVLKRFNPKVLERRLAQKSMIDSLLPMNRKAKLWDLYSDMYEDVAKEAQVDFQTLLSKELLRAYHDQMDKLQRQEKSRSGSS